MGFHFRKTAKFGPIHLNFSKSGIGVSAGVKGARISTGPRGTYIHAGRNGFYYHQRLGHNPTQRPQVKRSPRVIASSQPASDNPFVIETADVSRLTETSMTDLLNQINERAARMRIAPIAILGTILAVIAVWSVTAVLVTALAGEDIAALATFAAFVLSLAVGIGGSILSWQIHKGDELERTTPLFYELEPVADAKFQNIRNACRTLADSSRIWRVHTNQPTWDWKRNAGASTLITRQPISFRLQQPPYIATNVEVWAMTFIDLTLFFLPDYIFVRQANRYGVVSYDSLQVSSSPTRFIEDLGVPPDAQIVDYTWRFVNKKGGPDRRFSNNFQLPIVQYGFLQLQSNTGLNIHLNVSNLAATYTFANVFDRTGAAGRVRNSGPQNEYVRRPGEERPYIDPKIKFAYDTLGVTLNASQEELVSAYRNLAKMYHPDKLASLAPEFIELAEERMKEINAAYEALKRR